jgi:uncharacterized protein (DUF1810 family)
MTISEQWEESYIMMTDPGDCMGEKDQFELSRFVKAQEPVYDRVLAELRGGRKRSHWMWFVFPQIEGLGHSSTTKYYSIKSAEEARRYLDHPVLGKRLRECAESILALEGLSASSIFGFPDVLKLKSSMTLFARVAEPRSVFVRVLEKYYEGQQDERTVALLERMEKKRR